MADIKQELEDQALKVNPFQDPRPRSGTEVGKDSLAVVQNPFDVFTLADQGQVPLERDTTREKERTLLQTLRKPVTSTDRKLALESGLVTELNQLGLNSVLDNLTFDSMGKLQLLSRLRGQFGEDFERNPVAQRILNLFDQSIPAEQTRQERETERRRLSTSQRTLDALLRGI